MKQDIFDKKLGSKLREFEESPPDNLFGRIENTIATKQPGAASTSKTGKTVWLGIAKYAGIAAVAVFAVVTGVLYIWDYNVEDIVNKPIAAVNGQTETETDNDIIPLSRPSEHGSSAQAEHRTLREQTSEQTYTDHTIAPEDAIEETIKRSTMPDLTTTDSRTKQTPESSYDEDAAKFWAAVLMEESNNKKKTGKILDAAIYAGNAGLTHGNSIISDMGKITESRMTIREKNASGGQIMYKTNPQYEGLLKHNMPVTIGIGVSYALADRVALHSGITYSFLHSEASLSQNSNYEIDQKLHYVGIPVGISYSFVTSDRWDIYVKGGGMLEKAIFSRSSVTTFTGTGSSSQSGRMKVRGVQMSVNGATGVMFRLNRHLGIYLEPGVSYYFENSKQPANYRTENPTSFSLNGGLRFTL